MKRRLAFGAVAILIYFVGAAITSRLDPFGTRPVLDGLSPPPPYRWVAPPRDLADANKKPFAGTFSVKFTNGRSEAGAFTIRDSQFSMILDPGVLTANGNPRAASISITPHGESTIEPPVGLHIDGNVYRIDVTAQPSGDAITSFKTPQRVILVYPADHSFVKPEHLIAFSPNGKDWDRLTTQDSTAQQQSSALIRSPGYVAVVTPVNGRSSGTPIVAYVLIGLAVVVLLGLLGWWIYRSSKRKSRRR